MGIAKNFCWVDGLINKKIMLLNANRFVSYEIDTTYFENIHENIGNQYISYSISKILGLNNSNTIMVNSLCSRDADAFIHYIEALEKVECIILVLQDHISNKTPDTWFDIAEQYIDRIDDTKKLIVVSLGVNSFNFHNPIDVIYELSENCKSFINKVADKSYSIGVRGYYEAEILMRLGVKNAVPVGCPSYFEMGPNRNIGPVMYDDLNKLVGFCGQPIYFANSISHSYLQGDFDWGLIQLIYSKKAGLSLDWTCDLLGSYRGKLWNNLRQSRIHYFDNFTLWKKHIKLNCYGVIGTRLHGGILAMNSGVVSINTNGDLRSRSSCEYLGIPYFPGEPKESDCNYIKNMVNNIDVETINSRYKLLYQKFSEWVAGCGFVLRHEETDLFINREINKVNSDEIFEILKNIYEQNSRVKACVAESDRVSLFQAH